MYALAFGAGIRRDLRAGAGRGRCRRNAEADRGRRKGSPARPPACTTSSQADRATSRPNVGPPSESSMVADQCRDLVVVAGRRVRGTGGCALGWAQHSLDRSFHESEILRIDVASPTIGFPALCVTRDLVAQWNAHAAASCWPCSALKRSTASACKLIPGVKLAYLKGTYDLLRERCTSAGDTTLRNNSSPANSPTSKTEGCHHRDVAHSPEEIVAEIRRQLALA